MNSLSAEGKIREALISVPAELADRLIEAYRGLKLAFLDSQHDLCGLRCGKFCEAMVRVLQHHVDGTYMPLGCQLTDFRKECDSLERKPVAAAPESARVIIPRALNFLYTIRNKRGIGHIGGDVDANVIDAMTCVQLADWCLCELIRLVHDLPLTEAQELLDLLCQRSTPFVWKVGKLKKLLIPGLDFKSQTLLLLYSEPSGSAAVETLIQWTEYSNKTVYTRSVLDALHDSRLVHFDRSTNAVTISPSGIRKVEQELTPFLRNN